jgi:hypothetical protein
MEGKSTTHRLDQYGNNRLQDSLDMFGNQDCRSMDLDPKTKD